MSTTPLSAASPSLTSTSCLAADRPSLGTTVRGTLIGGTLAVVAALAVFVVGNIGSPVRVITGWAPDGTDLGVPDVIITTVVSVLVAAAGLAILERVAANGLRIWTIAVAAVTVLSFLPLWRLDIDAGSKVALSAMHLAVGVATITGQLVVRRDAR